MTAAPRVLFVCEGNICRSPLAAALFRQAWQRSVGQLPGVDSAGTRAPASRPAHDLLRTLVADTDRDVVADLDAHRSKRTTAALLQQHDLVVTMERAHRSELMDLDPRALRKVFTLGELAALEGILDRDGVLAGSLRGRSLSEMVGEHRIAIAAEAEDVADPVDGTAEDFVVMAQHVGTGVARLAAVLRRWVPATGTSSLDR